jgi:hypothetical protein
LADLHSITCAKGAKMNCNELQEANEASCYLIKQPRPLQWFYKGRLVKGSGERQAGRFELFLDLLCTCFLFIISC